MGKFLLTIVFAFTFTNSVYAKGGGGGSSSSSSSSSSSGTKNIMFQLTGGTSQLDQYMATEHVEHPLAGMVAGRYRLGPLQGGVCYFGMYHSDATGANPPGQTPNTKEVDATETFNLTSVCGGFFIGDFLMLDAGFGYAAFARKESQPYALSTQSSSWDAKGTGMMVGATVIPIHIADHVGIGGSYYYFDASATDYSSDVINGTTETTKSSGNGRVHTFGWFYGITLLFNL